jgi:hypothetical protein
VGECLNHLKLISKLQNVHSESMQCELNTYTVEIFLFKKVTDFKERHVWIKLFQSRQNC